MDKLKMHSPDFTDENIARLAELFPNCVTEADDENGKLKKVIDFDQLRQELTGATVEGPRERYHINWPGKKDALLAANAPIAKTLRPCREESVSFDDTKNIFVEGDNLDTLKLLRECYLNKVKMIYIDPPYNTGKNRIYIDDFVEDTEEYLKRSQQKDESGVRLVANNDMNGRYHSDWLSMIYPRLKVARDFLTDDGVIFISIGDHEIHNLRHMCDEIFGRKNFIAQFVWRTDGNFDNQAKVKSCHEYVVVYARNESAFPNPPVVDPGTPETSKLFNDEIRNTIVKNGPRNPVSRVTLPIGFPATIESGTISARMDSWPHYETDAIISERQLTAQTVVSSGWSSKDLLQAFLTNKCKPIFDSKGQETTFEISASGAIEAVKKRSASQSHVISVIGGMGGSQKAAAELDELGIAFDDYPKPTQLIQYFLQMNTGSDYLVMDFFAGSCTTAHAVFKQNCEDGGCRRVIVCQLPEPCEPETAAYEMGHMTIADIGKERMRSAGTKLKEENATTAPSLDVGFRVLKVDASNMKDVYYSPDEVKQEYLLDQVNNIKEDRTSEDLLFQVLLDWGVDLGLSIDEEVIEGKSVFFFDENSLVACFDVGISEELVKKLAARNPIRAIFRDSGYGDDSTKINVEQIFKLISPSTEVKTI